MEGDWVKRRGWVRRGFSLLEVLVAMVLLGIIVSGMLATFSIVGKGPGKLSVPELQALNYARYTLENLSNSISEDPVRGAALLDDNPDPNIGTTYSVPIVDLPTFTREYTVNDVDMNGDGVIDYKSVTVTVQWPN